MALTWPKNCMYSVPSQALPPHLMPSMGTLAAFRLVDLHCAFYCALRAVLSVQCNLFLGLPGFLEVCVFLMRPV